MFSASMPYIPDSPFVSASQAQNACALVLIGPPSDVEEGPLGAACCLAPHGARGWEEGSICPRRDLRRTLFVWCTMIQSVNNSSSRLIEVIFLRLSTWDSDNRRGFGNIGQEGLISRIDPSPHFYSIDSWGVWQAIERGHRFLYVVSILWRGEMLTKCTHFDLPSSGILWSRGIEDCKSSTDQSSGLHKESLTHLWIQVNSIAILENGKHILTDEDALTIWIVKFANFLQSFENDIVWRVNCLCDSEYSMCRWLCSSKRRAVFDVVEPVQWSLAMKIEIGILGGNYIKEALWRRLTADLMISNGPDEALTQKLSASIACSRTPLDGNELRYSKGASTTWLMHMSAREVFLQHEGDGEAIKVGSTNLVT